MRPGRKGKCKYLSSTPNLDSWKPLCLHTPCRRFNSNKDFQILPFLGVKLHSSPSPAGPGGLEQHLALILLPLSQKRMRMGLGAHLDARAVQAGGSLAAADLLPTGPPLVQQLTPKLIFWGEEEEYGVRKMQKWGYPSYSSQRHSRETQREAHTLQADSWHLPFLKHIQRVGASPAAHRWPTNVRLPLLLAVTRWKAFAPGLRVPNITAHLGKQGSLWVPPPPAFPFNL